MKKALSTSDLLSKKFKLYEFEGEMLEAFSKPERAGTWFVWGNSGNGKTSFILELVKELSKFDKVLYNSLEEGDAHTMQQAWKRHNMHECGRKIQLISESIEDLLERLRKRQSANVIVIDSYQYTQMDFRTYLKMKQEFKSKLFVFTSQANGKNPEGRTAMRVMYDASLKIWIEGYRAFSKGRYIGENGGVFTIWEKGAEQYWGTNTENNNE